MKTVTMAILLTHQAGASTPAFLTWNPADALAVKLTFPELVDDEGKPNAWTFALDLITTITEAHALKAGLSDVQTGVEKQDDGTRLFFFYLESPFGQAKLTTPFQAIMEFSLAVEKEQPPAEMFEAWLELELNDIIKSEEGI